MWIRRSASTSIDDGHTPEGRMNAMSTTVSGIRPLVAALVAAALWSTTVAVPSVAAAPVPSESDGFLRCGAGGDLPAQHPNELYVSLWIGAAGVASLPAYARDRAGYGLAGPGGIEISLYDGSDNIDSVEVLAWNLPAGSYDIREKTVIFDDAATVSIPDDGTWSIGSIGSSGWPGCRVGGVKRPAGPIGFATRGPLPPYPGRSQHRFRPPIGHPKRCRSSSTRQRAGADLSDRHHPPGRPVR
jgi:hypothetical protein